MRTDGWEGKIRTDAWKRKMRTVGRVKYGRTDERVKCGRTDGREGKMRIWRYIEWYFYFSYRIKTLILATFINNFLCYLFLNCLFNAVIRLNIPTGFQRNYQYKYSKNCRGKWKFLCGLLLRKANHAIATFMRNFLCYLGMCMAI